MPNPRVFSPAAIQRRWIAMFCWMLVCAAAGTGIAPAQQATPGSPPEQLAGTDAVSAGTSATLPDGRVRVNFPNAPIQAIIPFYIQLTGKKIILDSGLQG
jgi:hypothetical protein